MSEVVDVPDDSPPRSPEVECPYSEEGSSEKTMETRKRNADAVDKNDGEGDDTEVVDVTPKKAKTDETEVEKPIAEQTSEEGEVVVVVEEPIVEEPTEEATQDESEAKEGDDEEEDDGEEDEEENGAEEEQEGDE